MMKLLKNSLTVRGDSLYCPLALSMDTYGNCLTDCWHCYLRNLNKVWGEDLKPADISLMENKLKSGMENKNPKSPLAHLLSQKKTIRVGNKSDPFQDAEKTYHVTKQAINLLVKYDWTFVIQTRHTKNMMEVEKNLMRAHDKKLLTVMPVISPGLEKDWDILERRRTTLPRLRIAHLHYLMKSGVPGGVNGEPFIPGFHTEREFEFTIRLLKSYGIKRYNTYNFHFTPFVAKRLHAIGVDIERIWYYNQDKEWKKILRNLLDLSVKYNVILGCPDFVNTGPNWVEKANTCCGIDVPHPCTFNTHYFKKYKQEGMDTEQILHLTYDGSAKMEDGRAIIESTNKEMYNLKDAGL